MQGGIRIVEVTLDSDDALGEIERLSDSVRADRPGGHGAYGRGGGRGGGRRRRGMCLAGPGPGDDRALPHLGVPAIPGALTPTEIERARSLGVELVKLFPGSLGGPKYVREVLAPLADVELLVSGA